METTRLTTAEGLATKTIAEHEATATPPSAVYQNSLLDHQVSGPAVDSSSVDLSSVNVPRIGIIRTPTELPDFDVDNHGEDESHFFPGPGRSFSPSDSIPNYTIDNTTDDLRLHLRDGKLEQRDGGEPVIEKILEERDNELIDDKYRLRNVASIEGIDTEINRAARTGHGLPEDARLSKRPNGAYEPSEKSNVTDLGAQGLHIASKEGRRKPAPWTDDERKRPIQDRLLEALRKVPGHREKKGFFAEQQLATLIDEECVVQELESCFEGIFDSETIRMMAQKICGTDKHLDPVTPVLFKKIFIILVLSEKINAIRLFLKDDVADRDLPLTKVPCRKGSSNIFGLARKGQKGVALGCFRAWSNLAIMRFEEWQWTTLAPFFYQSQRKNVKHWILQDQIPLPFTADSRYDAVENADARLEFEGGFSNVFKVGIHPDHHDFHAPHFSSQNFAIKCLLSRDREEFKREADTLMKFSGDAHPHLISLLATYEQFKRFYLIFPWAQGDLVDYWSKKNKYPSVDYENILWVAAQISGITDGLSKIHRYESTDSKYHQSKPYDAQLDPRSAAMSFVIPASKHRSKQLFGRHGDIKPQNILWFQDPDDENDKGILKITDFGLTEFSANHSKSYKPNNNIAASPSYRPPEFDLQDGLIGRSYDIWTLGCLYLELITWFLGGWDFAEKFRVERMAFDPMWFDYHTDTFFEIVRCKVTNNTLGAMVKPKVTRFIFELHCHPSCTEYIHDLLNLIQMDILIVKSPNDGDKIRISCMELNKTLLTLLEKCQNDREYASLPAPWDKFQKHNEIVEEAVEAEVAAAAATILSQKNLRVHDGRTQKRVAPDNPVCDEELQTLNVFNSDPVFLDERNPQPQVDVGPAQSIEVS